MIEKNRANSLKKNRITKEQIIADFVVNPENYTEKEQQTAFDLLAAETEEQQECEYCHDKNGKPFTKEKLISTMYGSYKEHSEYVKRVCYCEICGRGLVSK